MPAMAAPATRRGKAMKKAVKSLDAEPARSRSSSPFELMCGSEDEGPMEAAAAMERRMSGSDYGSAGSESEDDESFRAGGVRLETRALSFSQMSRIYGKNKRMGIL